MNLYDRMIDWESVIYDLDIPKIRKSSNYLMCNCPLHDDPGPSCMVVPDEGRFYCFGCKRSGTILEFVRHALGGVSSGEALRYARQFKKDASLRAKRRRLKTPPVLIPHSFLDAFQDNFEYLQSRGISESTQRAFNVKWDKQKNQLVFPVYNQDGQIAFVKYRFIDEKDFYYWPKDNFNKSLVYRIDLIEPHNGAVILVEGEIDCLRLWDAGVRNVAAVLGSNPRGEQIEALKAKGANTIFAMFDNDHAGEDAHEKLKEISDIDIEKIKYPGGDPGELSDNQITEIVRGLF